MSEIDICKLKNYFTGSFKEYGPTSKGVDWKNDNAQSENFEILLSLFDHVPNKEDITVNDLGCGYGEFYKFVLNNGIKLKKFFGYDISDEMIAFAKENFKELESQCEWIVSDSIQNVADLSFASGVFTLKLSHDHAAWLTHIKKALHNMNDNSSYGFGFNMLTNKVDWEIPKLYYADPAYFMQYCKQEFKGETRLIEHPHSYFWTILFIKSV